MKIAVLIPSRNRPLMLSAAITTLREMESVENEVEYRIGYDIDDKVTESLMFLSLHNSSWSFNNVVWLPSQERTIGAIWNKLAFISGSQSADIYSCMIDDAFTITPHWDKVMVEMAKRYDAFSWFEVSAPTNIGYPTCTKSWLDKVGYIVPEHFPFWFMDSWFGELVQFVTNNAIPMTQQLALFSKQEATQNLRDLNFWWAFFNKTRVIRIKEAHRISGSDMALEEFTASRAKWVLLAEQRDAQFIGQQRLLDIENAKAATSEPSARYMAAKSAAEEYLKQNGLS